MHVYIGMFSMYECVYDSETTELNCTIELSVVYHLSVSRYCVTFCIKYCDCIVTVARL